MQRAAMVSRRERRKQRARREHPKHASLIRRIENQYRLSVSEPISRTAACTAANVKRDVLQYEIFLFFGYEARRIRFLFPDR